MRATKAAVTSVLASVAFAALAQDSVNDTLPRDALVKQWWQRYLSIPNSVNESLGETADACGLGQWGNTWFLSVATPEGPVTRHCMIPRGRKIFVPLTTAGCAPFPGETLEQNIQICREAIDPYDVLSLTIDGQERHKLIERRTHSRGFSAWFPEDNSFDVPEQDVPEGVYIMVAEGQFALVDALPVGEHVIRARASSTTDENVPEFDVTYRIMIVAPTSVVFR